MTFDFADRLAISSCRSFHGRHLAFYVEFVRVSGWIALRLIVIPRMLPREQLPLDLRLAPAVLHDSLLTCEGVTLQANGQTERHDPNVKASQRLRSPRNRGDTTNYDELLSRTRREA
jgi:hypothetical protein